MFHFWPEVLKHSFSGLSSARCGLFSFEQFTRASALTRGLESSPDHPLFFRQCFYANGSFPYHAMASESCYCNGLATHIIMLRTGRVAHMVCSYGLAG